MSIAVAEPVKAHNWESHEASAFHKDAVFATRVRGVPIHDDGSSVDELLEVRSLGRAESVDSYAASSTHGSGVCDKRGVEWAKRSKYIWGFDQRLEHCSW